MSNTFKNLSEQIAAGTLSAEDVLKYSCDYLTSNEKLALLTALSEELVADARSNTLASVLSGMHEGADDTVVVPNFLTGRIQLIDTDGTATTTLDGTHQFVTDSLGDSYPEDSVMEWGGVAGQYYGGRTLTVPTGVTMLYTFVLN